MKKHYRPHSLTISARLFFSAPSVQYGSAILLAYRFLALPLLHRLHPFFLPLPSNCFTLYYLFMNHD